MNREGAKSAKRSKGFIAASISGGRMDIEEVAKNIVESAYQHCLAHELRKRNLRLDCEAPLPIVYDGERIDAGYRIDMLVEDCVVVENKAVDQVLPIHEAQLLTYLKLRNCRLGFLLNWNVALMKHGIKRMVNNL
ncbi:MAG TPA: GxxExxY protein [Anaerolineae bacterium]